MGIQQMLLGTVGATPIQATGGTKSTPGDGYVYHQFTSSGSFVVTEGAGEIKYVVIGGGGGGGSDMGGGGGAGAFNPGSAEIEGPLTYPITIGAGGGTNAPDGPGISGNPSVMTIPTGTPVVAGGGGSGGNKASTPGQPHPSPGSAPATAGSGGGTGAKSPFPAVIGGSGALGNPGGYGGSSDYPGPTPPTGGYMSANSGGGGGAGAAAADIPIGSPLPYSFPSPTDKSHPYLGAGGAGKTLPWIPTAFGVSGYFAGGGGGGGKRGLTRGGTGGGGEGAAAGESDPYSRDASAGTANTGSGGGGGAWGSPSDRYAGKPGGSGTVLIRYEA
tara:strand:- start:248 stop:1237 length:990 start_codon:yes stop_codon:yes gene_type:complete